MSALSSSWCAQHGRRLLVQVSPTRDHLIEASRDWWRLTERGNEAGSEAAGRRTGTESEAMSKRALHRKDALVQAQAAQTRQSCDEGRLTRRGRSRSVAQKGNAAMRSEKSAEVELAGDGGGANVEESEALAFGRQTASDAQATGAAAGGCEAPRGNAERGKADGERGNDRSGGSGLMARLCERSDYLRTHWPGLRDQLLAGVYQWHPDGSTALRFACRVVWQGPEGFP